MWYRHIDQIVDLSKVIYINIPTQIAKKGYFIYFTINEKKTASFEYGSMEERDAELEKICKLLGLSEPQHISRCC